MKPRTLLAVAVSCPLAWGACSDDDPEKPADVSTCTDVYPSPDAEGKCEPGYAIVEDGRCRPAGVPPCMLCQPGAIATASGGCCPAGTMPLEDGTCRPAGIPPEACGKNFVPDGNMGCEPILPEQPCSPGLIAVPGDTECRELSPCGAESWDDIPVDADTVYVDASYEGDDSDGSQARPWPTIQAGIEAAAAGAVVAVAAGTYVEDLRIEGKPVELWGRCPALVEVVGSIDAVAAIDVRTGAEGTEVHQIAVTGETAGLGVSGSTDVSIHNVWVHDTAYTGIIIEDFFGPTGVELRGLLVEAAAGVGIYVDSATMTVEATAVRDIGPYDDGQPGIGLLIRSSSPDERPPSIVRGSVIERAHDTAVLVIDTDATIEETVMRNTTPDEPGQFGVGIHAKNDSSYPSLVMSRSLVSDIAGVGVLLSGADATISATVVRRTGPSGDGLLGRGINIQSDPDTERRSSTTLSGVVVDANSEIGVSVSSSDATIELAVIRDTATDAAGALGRGVNIVAEPTASTITLRSSIIERNHDMGISISDSDAMIEATVVRDTAPGSSGAFGRGVGIKDTNGRDGRTKLLLRSSLLSGNSEIGLSVVGADATIEATSVQGTLPNEDGELGWGIGIQIHPDSGEPADATIRDSLIERNTDIGLAVFSSSVIVEQTTVRDTLPDAHGEEGRGISVQADLDDGDHALARVRGALVESNSMVGIFLSNSDSVVEDSIVRNTLPDQNNYFGRGIHVRSDFPRDALRSVVVQNTLIEQNNDFGIASLSADLVLARVLVVETQSNDDERGGDGLAIISMDEIATASITDSRVASSARAGLAIWGADVEMGSTAIECNKFDINGEDWMGRVFKLQRIRELDENLCGCPRAADECQTRSAGISPPSVIEPPRRPAP